MQDLVLGVDPGFYGCAAIYSAATKEIVDLIDMPIVERRGKKHVDLACLNLWLEMWKPRIRLCVFEEVGSMPGNGSSSSFRFGYYAGVVSGMLHAHQIPVFAVKPAVWKAMYNLSSDKDLSRTRATELIPKSQKYWLRKKDDGRAEASLLALLGEKWTLT